MLALKKGVAFNLIVYVYSDNKRHSFIIQLHCVTYISFKRN